ncbi:MAG: hypothetical protein KatS3mg108_2573 [Isosphaeraceae bacterium]|jgi:RHS repeat-associated protein|nr:MAG: hypothetical protein KatS3mg108_2573 [Isosphaeraceae bacterium]
MGRTESFTERRRRRLSRQASALEVLEARNSVGDLSSPMGLMHRAIAGSGLAAAFAAAWRPRGDEAAAPRTGPRRRDFAPKAAPGASVVPVRVTPAPVRSRPGLAALYASLLPPADWPTLTPMPAPGPGALGGSSPPAADQPSDAGPARPGSEPGGGAARGAITPLRVLPPPALDPVPFAAASVATGPTTAAADDAAGDPAPAGGDPGTGDGGGTRDGGEGTADAGDGGTPFFVPPPEPDLGLFEVGGLDAGVATGSFTNFTLYTLDYNDGVVLFPGFAALATPNASEDLRAQVKDDAPATYTYSWATTGLSDATNISASGHRLTFKWASSPPTARTNTVTLTVTQAGTGLQEIQTYTFWVPAYTSFNSTVVPTWPNAVGPDLAVPGGPAFDAHAVSVDALSGAVNTAIGLPAYGPNLAPLALEYDSLAADARPMVVVHHPLDAALAVPTKTSVRLTFDAVDGSTYFYDTADFIAGDIAQFAVQVDATAKSTGRYAYSVRVVDDRAGALTTTTYGGTMSLVNEKDSALGAGWTLRGLNRIHSATGGVILNVGRGESLWFTAGSSSGGTTPYTSPAGDFSTLTKTDATGVYARTLKDGTRQHFDANGYQTAVEDRNGLRVTFSYSSNRLQTILDPYSQRTTFAYDGGNKLDAITDPAGRVTDLTVASGNLTSALLADNARLTFAYDASKRMTVVTDPNSRTTTVAYDAAGRADVVTRPDLSTQSFDPYQVRGYDTSGTSGSPAPATLLAEARATHVDPRGNSWDLRPDWRGMGLVNQPTDPLGNVATSNRDANGLATVVVDRLSRIATATYDAKGNLTRWTYPDGDSEQFTYNGFAQATEHVNPSGGRTTLTYDAEGNLTGVRDPLSNRTTFTYTANGRVETARDPRSNVTTYQYDAQDRLTTIVYPAIGGTSATTRLAYDSKGNVATVTDERGNSTTYAYDALNRPTGQRDALGNRTTITYDSGGNPTVVQLPTPAGQTARTTTYAYDAMDRVTTVTAPLSRVSGLAYDSGGNLIKVTDALSRVTTHEYDALGRRTVTIDPLSGRTTLTYDAEGQVLTTTDPLGSRTTYAYTSRGLVATATGPTGVTATYTYTGTGKLGGVLVSNPGGSPYQVGYFYDAADRRTAVADGLGHRVTTVYDSGGNAIARVDALSKRTTFTYDARNRLESMRDALQSVTTFVLDEAGNRTVVVDPNGKRTTTAYDALNRATTLTDARGGVTELAFDEAGRNTAVVDPVSNRTTFEYDAADRVTTMVDALGTVTLSYDLADQLTGRKDRIGRRVTYAYDSGGRRTSEWWINTGGSVARRITFTYDSVGRLASARDADARLTFTYDSGGRLTAAGTSGTGTGQPAVTLTYGYDQAGNRASLTDDLSSVGRTTYQYDAAQRLTTVTRSVGGAAGPRVQLGYDAADRRTSIVRSVNGARPKLLTTFSYDAADRLTTIVHGKEEDTNPPSSGSVYTPLATFAYGYDSGGRLTTESNAEGLATYSYDDTNQLTGVDKSGTSNDESFGYDLNGNRNTTGYATTTGNRTTAAPGYTFGYDAEGNMTTRTQLNGAGTADDEVTTFAYDHRNRLTGATSTVNGAVTMRATYAYDPVDRRIRTDVDLDGAGAGAATVTWTAYDGQNAYADFNSAGAVVKRYLFALGLDELLARTDANGSNADWYLVDRLGTVRDVVDATTVASEWHAGYAAFGAIVTQTGAGGDRYTYTGRELMAETGDMHYRRRTYSTIAGRFQQHDPIGFDGGDGNLYRYVANGPTAGTDPTGTIVWSAIFGAISGGAAGFIAGGGVGTFGGGGFNWGNAYAGLASGMVAGAVTGLFTPIIGSIIGEGLIANAIAGFIGGFSGGSFNTLFVQGNFGTPVGSFQMIASPLAGAVLNAITQGNPFASALLDGFAIGLLVNVTTDALNMFFNVRPRPAPVVNMNQNQVAALPHKPVDSRNATAADWNLGLKPWEMSEEDGVLHINVEEGTIEAALYHSLDWLREHTPNWGLPQPSGWGGVQTHYIGASQSNYA